MPPSMIKTARRRDTSCAHSRLVTRMSTIARRAALSRITVTPPDHQDSREHQLEGLSPGGGAEWPVDENGGFCDFSKTYRLCQTFATSPRGAPRLTCSGRRHLTVDLAFNPRNSVLVSACTIPMGATNSHRPAQPPRLLSSLLPTTMPQFPMRSRRIRHAECDEITVVIAPGR